MDWFTTESDHMSVRSKLLVTIKKVELKALIKHYNPIFDILKLKEEKYQDDLHTRLSKLKTKNSGTKRKTTSWSIYRQTHRRHYNFH